MGHGSPDTVAVEAVMKQYEDLRVITDEIDDFHLFPETNRPDLAYDKFDCDVPVIDLSPVLKLEKLRKEIAGPTTDSRDVKTIQEEIDACVAAKATAEKEIRAACELYGFFQVVNHGIPGKLFDTLTELFKYIFGLPMETKLKFTKEISPGRNSGYSSLKRDTPFNTVDGSHIWNEGFDMDSLHFHSDVVKEIWPKSESDAEGQKLRSTLLEYWKESVTLSFLLADMMTASLGLPLGSFDGVLGGDRNADYIAGRLRVNHYPVCPQPERTWGIQGHTDLSVFTLLYQDAVGGLQICFKDGSWHGVRPVRGALVVNVGDFLQATTNGRFISAEHRVVANAKASRLSIALFAYNTCNRDAVVRPSPKLVDADHPLRYRAFTITEYANKVVQEGLSKDRNHILSRTFPPV